MTKITILFIALCSTLMIHAQMPMGGGMGMGGGMPMRGMPMGGGMGMDRGMGGFSQQFYVLEADSISSTIINASSEKLNLNAKQIKKMIKLYSQEYQEECRVIQSSVLDNQLSTMGGFGRFGGNMGLPTTPQEPQRLDTLYIKKTYFEISDKYDKRYGKILEDEQAVQWKKMETERKEKEFLNLLRHVSDNTESLF